MKPRLEQGGVNIMRRCSLTPTESHTIEYIRTDAFIEKACEYFAPHINDNSGGYDRAFVLEGFKKYMKGE